MKNHPRSSKPAGIPVAVQILIAALAFTSTTLAQNVSAPVAPAIAATESESEAEAAKPEPLQINRYPSYYYRSQPLTPQPEIILRFNAGVPEETARSHFALRDKDNRRRIPVEISRPSAEAVKPLQPYGGDDPENLLPIDHFLLLKPLAPLPIGIEWRLEMKAGLASADGKFELAETRTDRIGTLHAFVVNSARAINHYDEPKAIRISLNKPIHESINGDVLSGFVHISPQPADLSIESNSYAITLKGDFRNGSTYRVSVMSGLVGHDYTRLERDFPYSVKFEANPGFVTLPAFSKAQNASGAKRFDISTGNLKSTRVRVKQLNDRDLIYALRGYDQLYEGDGGSEQQIPYEMVPGRTIHDQRHERKAGIDHSEKITLKWPELLGGETHAGLFICAEGTSATRKNFSTGAQAIIQLTDIGMAWKQNSQETLLYTFSLQTGKPLANLKIQLLDAEAETRADFSTDKHGVTRIPETDRIDVKWLAARNGKDRHIIEFQGHQSSLSLWQFSIPYRYYNDDVKTERRTLIFTDRPVYKPGERVHLKCLTRLSDFDALLPPGEKAKARLKVYDARRRVIHSGAVTVSEHGSIEDSFQLPEEKTLGWYSIELDFNTPGQTSRRSWLSRFHHQFQVAEYRPNTFEIAVESNDAYTADADLSIPVTAKYYMGKPLSKAQLQWHVSAGKSYPRVPGFDRFFFGDTRSEQPNFTASQTVQLTESGMAHINFDLPDQGEHPAPMRVTVNAEITDINQQTVAESAGFMVNSSDFYLGVEIPEGVLRAGEPVPLSIAAVGADSQLHPGAVEATLKIEKLSYNTVKIRSAGGRLTTKSEEQLTPVSEQPVTVKTRHHKETGLPLATEFPVTVKEGGDYLVSLSAADENGNPVFTRARLGVLGADERSFRYHDNIRIDVKPDKEQYKVGDTAKLLVRSPLLGHALITTERAGVKSTRTQAITSHESVIEIPILEGAAPNLFASVMIIRGITDSTHQNPNTDYRAGFCQLNVSDPAADLDVTIESGNEPYALPGSAVEIAALVQDHEGKPVANTEVTLYAVDEGVLSLTGYQTPDPKSTFHAPFPLSVRTGQNISDLLSEDPLDQEFSNKGYVIGGGGGKGIGPDPSRVRKNFKALAFWGGSMLTGPDGRVRASFTAPDNLTTYRVMAVAASGNRFGSADAKLVINKPLILEPALPAFGNVDDLMDLSAVLHNNTEEPLDLEIQVELDRHAEFHIAGKAGTPNRRTERFRIPAGGTNALSFPVAFTRMGTAKWNWKVVALENPELTDSVESTLEIGYPVPLLRNLENLTLTDPDTPTDALASVDSKLLNGRGKIRVTLSNSRVLEAVDALNYLLRYPYGCVEQTTSSTLPWLSTQNLRQALPQLNRSDEEIDDAIKAGTNRLLSMQTSEGGLGYWPGASEASPWGSAYGGLALALAKKSGADLPEERLNAIWDYLSKNLRTNNKHKSLVTPYQRCLAAWTLALAGRSEPAYHDLLYRTRHQLSPDSRAVLALAMIEAAGDNRDEALSERVGELLADAKDLPKNDSHWYRASFTSAMQLAAWSKWDPLNSRTNQLVDDLMNAPRTRAAWGSTYLNSWTVFALATHTEASGNLFAGSRCTVKFGNDVREVTFGDQFAGEALEFEFEGDYRKIPLELQIDAKSRIYAHIEIESQPEIATFQAENNGFGITRTYHKLDAAGEVHPVDDLEVGDLVLVSLHLAIPEQKARYQYLAIDDPLPSTFEAINPNFKSQAGKQKNAQQGKWKRLWANHTELRTDRALFFCDYLYQGGDYAVQYLARVVAPGAAHAPPAKIEAMYEPHRYGLSKTTRIVATPLQLNPPEKVAQN